MRVLKQKELARYREKAVTREACKMNFRRTANSCNIARRIPRVDAGYRPPHNVAAIDFGTTNCSLAYIIAGGSKSPAPRNPNLLSFNGVFYRVPTAVLFGKDGAVTHFGENAREVYNNHDEEEQLECAYFEQIKMNLQQDKSVNREMKVKAQDGKEYYLVEVIAHILQYLKDELIKKLKHADYNLEATDFDWVITVPAIWRARGKQMMREAGYKAGLCSQGSCMPLQPAISCPHLPEPPVEKHPEKLSLALEPEAAAIFCQNMSKEQLAQSCQADAPFTASCYLIIDIGGGTVDISAMHRVVEGNQTYVQVLHPPIGNDCGGVQVNEIFKCFLETLVQDQGLERFLSTPDRLVNARNQVVLNELVNTTFEKQKKIFGNWEASTDHRRLQVELPYEFLETYQSDLEKEIKTKGDKNIELVRNKLRISYDKMAEFFDPVRDGILECIAKILKNIKEKVETFYLVGGFGGCRYLFRAIKGKFGDEYKYIVPCEPAYAVVRGAVLNCLYPDMVECRKVDATYGLASIKPFIPHLHDPDYGWYDDDREYKCKSLFSTIVQQGELVKSGEVFRKTHYPVNHNQTNMGIEIYCSDEKDVWYVTGQRPKGSPKTEPVNVYQIGRIILDMPDLTADKCRAVDITFDFSHTEIQVQAFDRTSTNEVRTVLDCLMC